MSLRNRDSADLVGHVLAGRYRLEELIGQGGMGAVYRGVGEEGRAVAIKVLTQQATGGEMGLRFARESRLLTELKHENLVGLIEAGRDDAVDLHYLVMPLMKGRDLRQVLDETGALDPTAAVRIVLQAAKGVQSAHRAGIVHRDLKPANLFLDRDEEAGELVVRVCDFGIAKRLTPGDATALTVTGKGIGSPDYISPEQIKSAKHVDERTDVWSLGATLYEMLTGRVPYAHAEGFAQLLIAITTEDAPPLQNSAPWVEPGLALAVHKALRRDPKRRWPTMAALVAALRRFSGGDDLITEDRVHSVPAKLRDHRAPRADLTQDATEFFEKEDEETDPVIGLQVGGKYKVLGLLGRGGMGSVYLAESSSGDKVAVKVLAASAAGDETAARRLVREARAARAVESPFVVKTLDAGADEKLGVPFIVLELLSGVDLAALLAKEGALEVPIAARLFAQAARGLAAAHSQGIVHRDVKPANLFLDCDETNELVTVKVCDFGVAKRLEGDDASTHELTRTGGMLGSPMYMSPEQARNAKSVGPTSDVWGLCIALWEALSGRKVWAAYDSLGGLILAICTEPIPRLELVAPWVPTPLADIVERGLARDPKARWGDAQELAQALDPFTEGTLELHSSDLRGLSQEFLAKYADRVAEAERDAHLKLGAHLALASYSGDTRATTEVERLSKAVTEPDLSLSTHGAGSHVTPPRASPPSRSLWIVGALSLAGVVVALAIVFLRQPRGEVAPMELATALAEPSASATSLAVETANDVGPAEFESALRVGPELVQVSVDGEALEVVDGEVELTGAPGTQFSVRLTLGEEHDDVEVVMGRDGRLHPAEAVLELSKKPAPAPPPKKSAVGSTKPPRVGSRPSAPPPKKAPEPPTLAPKDTW